mgnify:CR=1 FL=1
MCGYVIAPTHVLLLIVIISEPLYSANLLLVPCMTGFAIIVVTLVPESALRTDAGFFLLIFY